MQIIRIKGVKEDADIIKRNLAIDLNDYPIFIVNRDTVLYRFVEDLKIDDSLLYRLKIAKEIDFDHISVVIEDRTTEDILLSDITSLSNLLQGIDENIIKCCSLIVDTEDDELISEIIQAFIYLNIDLEVMMKKEKDHKKILDTFRREFEKIRVSVVEGKKALYNIYTSDEFRNEKDILLNTLYEIEDNLEKARERDLNISVMATKKAGKSTIVNSFLNEQFAPTSLELPTPNTCIYKRSKDEKIRLIYGGEDIFFKTPEDMNKYIYKEFKKAQYDITNGCTIDDMEIYYTKTDNSFYSYTLIDTPGSNYALARDAESGENIHKKISYKWIQKSDVVLFLINYSSYLSVDEEEFFKSIKAEFEKYNKFYSLVIVVNKLDEMYISELENTSVVRFLDYIRCKLYDLGYKGFIVMGTSARSYFDIIRVCKIDKEMMNSLGEKVSIEKLKGTMLRERFKEMKKNFTEKKEISALSFVDDQLEKLESFYRLGKYDLNTLKYKSGIPNLIKYTTNIAIQKAHLEVYGVLIRRIDEKFIKLKNNSIICDLVNLKNNKNDEVEEIGSMLQDISNSVQAIEQEMKEKLSFEKLNETFSKDIEIFINKRLKYISELCEKGIDDFFTELTLKNSEQLKMIKNKTMDVDLSKNNKIVNEEMNIIVENFLEALNIELDKKEAYIREAESKMKGLVQVFSEIIRKEYNLKEFNIEVPKIDQDYKKMLLVKIPVISAADSIIEKKLIDSIELRGNMVSKLFNHIMRNRYGFYTINNKQLQIIKSEYVEYIRSNKKFEYYDCYSLLKTNLLRCTNDYKLRIDETFRYIKETYESIFADVLKNLTDSKVNIESQLNYIDNKLKFYNDIDKVVKPFIKEWNVVRDALE